MAKEKLQFTNGNYFCGATQRPDCLRKAENTCCLYCNEINKCQELNKSKIKPCTADIICMDEYCEFSLWNLIEKFLGGSLSIPDGWCVCRADFDVEEPYIMIFDSSYQTKGDVKILVPKALAYYLSTHHCGSEKMRNLIKEHAICDVRDTIKDALRM